MKHLRFCPFSTCIIVLLIHVFLCFCTEGFDSLLELPHSGSNMTRPRSNRVFFVGHFGAKGNGVDDDTQAFKDVWERACSFPRRTRIVIPAGFTMLTRPIDFGGPCKSKVTLVISGTIVAPKDPDVWKGLNRRKWLYFHGVNHLSVEGGGTINGMGREWWARSCKINISNVEIYIAVLDLYFSFTDTCTCIFSKADLDQFFLQPCRHAPTALTFHKCKNLKVKNLMLVNSQQMHISFTQCLRVVASHLKVIAPTVSPNTDGIHISASRGVEVKDSLVETGDDCVSIVNNSSRIKIRNIACGPGHGISIGSLGKFDSWAQVHDVIVDGAFISNTENGLRIKTWQGGSGFATDITFQNILMDNVSNPIIIDQYYCDSLLPCENQTVAVKVENISFKNIKGTSATEESIRFACSDDLPCQGLYLEDVQLVSPTGEITTSFCWKAYGSSLGIIDPPSCFACTEGFIQQMVPLDFAIHSF
ncbi:hypothetical protein Ddye_011428 [Dipteronia dyeriana]|uniref:Polygalacturonase n=1 Tax=Dipteronia dyeriana TaxID=168575 RepID=A0AAD9X2I4_9ROSI|nr:hypothetical protein Ddye_011428 [Dipteronia dyeriana]